MQVDAARWVSGVTSGLASFFYRITLFQGHSIADRIRAGWQMRIAINKGAVDPVNEDIKSPAAWINGTLGSAFGDGVN